MNEWTNFFGKLLAPKDQWIISSGILIWFAVLAIDFLLKRLDWNKLRVRIPLVIAIFFYMAFVLYETKVQFMIAHHPDGLTVMFTADDINKIADGKVIIRYQFNNDGHERLFVTKVRLRQLTLSEKLNIGYLSTDPAPVYGPGRLDYEMVKPYRIEECDGDRQKNLELVLAGNKARPSKLEGWLSGPMKVDGVQYDPSKPIALDPGETKIIEVEYSFAEPVDEAPKCISTSL